MTITTTALTEAAYKTVRDGLIKDHEGFRELPYLDSAKNPTIGYGLNMKGDLDNLKGIYRSDAGGLDRRLPTGYRILCQSRVQPHAERDVQERLYARIYRTYP